MGQIALTTLIAESTLQQMRHVVAPYMWVFFIAFFVAFTLTPLMRVLALRNGVVDRPDLQRKEHRRPVAYLGGVAIFLGWLAAVVGSYFIAPHAHGAERVLSYVHFPISVILGAGAIALTGLFDDVYHVSPRVKVGGQLFAAAALSTEEAGINLVGHAAAMMGIPCSEWVAYVLGGVVIALFVLGGCNAMNLLDGLDGLAAGVGAIVMGGFLMIAALVAVRHGDSLTASAILHDPVRLVMCIAVFGALLGFLPFNFNPATIFMGDAGSLLLGYFCVATILLFSSSERASLLVVTACMIVFAIPVVDTALAIFRRKLRRMPILSPDKEHIHHLLRRSGMTVRQAVLSLYAAAALFSMTGFALIAMDFRWRYIIAVLVVAYAFGMVLAYKIGRRQRELASPAAGEQPAAQEPALTPMDQTDWPELAKSTRGPGTLRPTGPKGSDPADGDPHMN
jgi:UDP-GlcNAc:undecaprenyl-phosphate GlcNAc-1-phosphate transferase